MTTIKVSRRNFLAGAAAVGGTAFGAPHIAHASAASRAAAAKAPFPVLASPRLTGHALSSYDAAIQPSGVAKDAIPSIDRPIYWSAARADSYLDPDDIVFGLLEGDTPRAYPQRVMVWHEVVNDTIDGMALTMSYCPLVGDVLAFERGETTFGVAGLTVNSNLVLFDRDTDTYFPQVLATGVRGPHAGAALVERPMAWTTWGRWRERFPTTRVLSTDTGAERDYAKDPYGGYNPVRGYYERDKPPMFTPMNVDERFAPKTTFLAARTGRNAIAVELDLLRDRRTVEIVADGEAFTAIYDPDLDTGYVVRGVGLPGYRIAGDRFPRIAWEGGSRPEPLNAFLSMWFALAGYYPGVVVAT